MELLLRHIFRASVNPDPGEEGFAKAAPVGEQLVDGLDLVSSPRRGYLPHRLQVGFVQNCFRDEGQRHGVDGPRNLT